jgi:hypothetical protein
VKLFADAGDAPPKPVREPPKTPFAAGVKLPEMAKSPPP